MPKVNIKDKRKQQLIDANMLSIARRGLTDTTIAHVSEGANLSRGIVNFYFTSKEKMMQETLTFLISEQTQCWQDALTAAADKAPLLRLEAMLTSLMGDRLCSARRIAVLSAFIGHAGTHASYARIISAGDELFIKQAKALWQEAGVDARAAEMRARQMLAVVRGHHTMTFIHPDSGKPSHFIQPWAEALKLSADAPKAAPRTKPAPVAEAAVRPKPARKPAAPVNQLDFGDLFSHP